MPSNTLEASPRRDRDVAPPPSPPGMKTFTERMKSCSVVTYSESLLFRLPWSTVRPGPAGERPMPVPDPKGPRRRGLRQFPVPGSFERAIFRALEWIAIDQSVAQGMPFVNPLVVHPRDLCERLCWRATQPQFKAIEMGFKALSWIRLRKTGGTGSFGLLRSAYPASPRGRGSQAICPSFIVYFDDRFVGSLNAGEITPVNWGLWIAVGNPVARRLLEVLEAVSAGPCSLESSRLTLEFLCDRIPLGPELGNAEQRALLDQAHEELIRHEYLERVEPLSRDRYRYHPGITYRAMRQALAEHHTQVKLNRVRSGWPAETPATPAPAAIRHNISRVCSSQ